MDSVRIILLTCLVVFLWTPSMRACPMCKEAIAAANTDGEETNDNLPLSYNRSIYLMVGMPYLALGTVGFLIYRGCRRNEAYRQALRDAEQRPV